MGAAPMGKRKQHSTLRRCIAIQQTSTPILLVCWGLRVSCDQTCSIRVVAFSVNFGHCKYIQPTVVAVCFISLSSLSFSPMASLDEHQGIASRPVPMLSKVLRHPLALLL